MERLGVDELGINYVEKLSLYEEYSSRIRNLVQDLVDRDGIELCRIDGWAKAPADLVRALDLPGEPVSLEAIADLVTVRVLLRFPDDVARVEDIICSEFSVDLDQSVPSSGLEDPFRFGYPAVAYTLSLSENRASLREWEKYKQLPFRLEIRTVLQEAWATISPRVNLNVDAVSEKKLKRKMVRLAALLEEADEGFHSLCEEAKNVGVLVPPSSDATPRQDTPLSVERTYTDDELYSYLSDESNGVMNQWTSAAVRAGFPIFVPSPLYLRDSFGYLCRILRAAGLDTMSEVKKFLAELEEDERGVRQLRSIRMAFEKESAAWRVDAFSALFLLVLNLKWDILKDKDLVQLEVKKGSDRISGAES